jgi:hypothetical protein
MQMLQQSAALVSKYQTEIEDLKQKLKSLEDQEGQNDQVIMNLKVKNFLFRWHIQMELQKMARHQEKVVGAEDYKRLLKDKSYVETVRYIQEKVTNDVEAQVLMQIGPMRQ